MSRGRKVEWVKAKAEYIANQTMSLKDVAIKYDASYDYLRRVAMKEHWTMEKKKRWVNAEREALEEVEGSIKDLIVRHAKVARFLQAGGIKRLQKRLRDLNLLDDDPTLALTIRQMDDRTLLAMVAEGLKAERELYPKQMQIQGDIGVKAAGISEALDIAIYEAFRKRIGRKRPSIHRKNSPKK